MKAFLLTQRSFRLGLLLGLALITFGAAAAPSKHLTRAQDALQQGDLPTAVIELKNTLKKNPENPLARALLGQTLVRQGNPAAAVVELERAKELGAEFPSLQPWLADAWFQTGEYTKVTELDPNAANSAVLKSQLLALQSRAALARGKLEEAESKAQSAIEADPKSAAPLLAMAQLQLARQNIDQAREAVTRALAAAPTDADAKMLLGEIEQRSGNLEAAETAFSEAMQDSLSASRAQLKRAFVRLQLKNETGAREDIDQLRKTLKKNPLVDYAEGLLFYTQGKYREAAESANVALGANPNLAPVLRLAGAAQLALGDPRLARGYLERFVLEQPNDAGAQLMLGMALLQTGGADRAEAIARQLATADTENTAALELLANALMAQGKDQEATDYLRKIKELNPSSPTIDTRLGLALLEQGDEEEGLRLLRETAQQNPESADAIQKLVAGLSRSGNLEEALKTALAYQQQHADSALAHILVAAVYLQQDQKEPAKVAFQRALDAEPGNLTASKALAGLAAQAKDTAEASKILKASLAQHPQDLSLLIALAKLAFAQSDDTTGKMYLDQALENHSDSIEPKLFMSAYSLRQGDADAALSFAADAIALEPKNAAANGLRADAQLALGDYQAARASLENLVEILDQPNPRVFWALARTEFALGDAKAARQALENSRTADPTFSPALIALGKLAIQQQDLAEAADVLAALKEQSGQNDRDVLILQGDLARLQGNLSAADEAFRSLIDVNAELDLDQDSELWTTAEQLVLAHVRAGNLEAGLKAARELETRQPDSARTHALLGMLHLQEERLDEATAEFEQALQLDPTSSAATTGLVSIAVQNKDFNKAQALYQDALQRAPSDLQLLVGSARLALLQEDPDGAEKSLLSAVEKNPQSTAARLYLGAFYLGQGQPDKALKLVSGPGIDPDKDPRLLGLKAESEIALNQLRPAIRTLDALNRLQPNQPKVLLTIANTQARLDDLASAKETLRQVISLQPESVPALRGLVRIALAEHLLEQANQHVDELRKILGADHGDVLRFEGQIADQSGDDDLALSKYRKTFDQSPNSADLLLMTGLLLRQEKVDDARELLTEWLNTHPQDNRVRFELAQLLLNRGATDEAIDQYQTLVDSGVDNPAVLNNLAWLLKDRDPAKALASARKAHEADPESADIADTLAVLLLDQQELGEATRLIEMALKAKPENPSMLYHKALILQKQGDRSEARSLVEKLLANPAPFPEKEDAQRWLDNQTQEN